VTQPISDTTDPATTLSAVAPFTLRTAPYFDACTWTHIDCRSFAVEDVMSEQMSVSLDSA